MALVFPSSASLNQTYQSGSSATYQYNGQFWNLIAPPTAIFVTAATASYISTPTVCLQGDYNTAINDNTTLYSAATVFNPSVLTSSFSVGGFTVSSTGITPSISGFYEISYNGWVQDNAGGATNGYFFIGVNNAEVKKVWATVASDYAYSISFNTIRQVTSGQLIDFRISTGGNQSLTIKDTTLTIKRVG